MSERSTAVLLIEGDAGSSAQIEAMLEGAQSRFELSRAGSVVEAATLLEDRNFDVVLLDLDLPGGGGLSSVSLLQDSAPGVPIVVLTTDADESLALQAVQVGAQDYLLKGRNEANVLMRSIHHAIERKRAENDLAYLAHFDHLTGLVNKSLFKDRLSHALTRTAREDSLLALLFIDLDRFKHINDAHGHHIGDLLLKSCAQRMRGTLRKVDTLSRLSGDEFGIVAEDIKDVQHGPTVARKILDSLKQPFILEGQELSITLSIGIVVSPFDGSDPERLLRNADEAMYRAKDAGGNGFRMFNEELIKAQPPA
jgi:diguanylate cyclase (GGDEF)-like protein